MDHTDRLEKGSIGQSAGLRADTTNAMKQETRAFDLASRVGQDFQQLQCEISALKQIIELRDRELLGLYRRIVGPVY